jgi:ribosomal protein L7/L12
MTQKEKEKILIENLWENFNSFKEAVGILKHSYAKCQRIGLKEKLNLDEQESFESLTSRFARASDILIQKVFKTITALSLEEIKTLIDRLNYMEKINVIESAQTFKEIRRLRNTIAHEYVVDDLNELFKDVLEYSTVLVQTVDKVDNYMKMKSFQFNRGVKRS